MNPAGTLRAGPARSLPWWQLRSTLLGINLLGGLAVLGSYALGLAAETGGSRLWGEVPATLRPLYSVCMLGAAAGYFAFTHLVFYRLDPGSVRVGRFGYGVFHALYLAILLPSALWMPLTVEMISTPGPLLWLSIRTVLAIVGLGSLGLLSLPVSVTSMVPFLAFSSARV